MVETTGIARRRHPYGSGFRWTPVKSGAGGIFLRGNGGSFRHSCSSRPAPRLQASSPSWPDRLE